MNFKTHPLNEFYLELMDHSTRKAVFFSDDVLAIAENDSPEMAIRRIRRKLDHYRIPRDTHKLFERIIADLGYS